MTEEAPKRNLQQEIVSWLLAAVLIYFSFRIISPFLTPLLWGVILTIFFFPFHRRVRDKIRRPNLAALLSTLIIAVVLIAPVIWLVPAFVSEAAQAIRRVPSQQVVSTVQGWMEALSNRLPAELEIDAVVSDALRALRGVAAQQSARVAGNLAAFLFEIVVALMTMFYLFRDGPRVGQLLIDVSPLAGPHRESMIQQAVSMISVTVSSVLVVAVAQGVSGGLVFWALDLPSPVFWGVVIAILAIIPLVGAWVVWIPAGLGLILNGETGRGVLLFVLGALIISGVDNVVRPLIIAGRSELNALLVLVSLFGGIATFGFVGIVLGPVIIAAAIGLLMGYREGLREPDDEASTDGRGEPA